MSGVSPEEFSSLKEEFVTFKKDINKTCKEIVSKIDRLSLGQVEVDEEVHLFGGGSSRGQARGLNIPDHSYAAQGGSNVTSAPSPRSTRVIPAAEDVQAEFKAITESVQKVQLPSDCVINKSALGISRELKTAHTIITQASKYTETNLKLLLNYLDQPAVGAEELSKIFTVQYAQLRYLQDELAALIVQGQFDQGTSKLFKSLQKNTSAFTPEALENLRSAAAIAATQAQVPRGRGGGRSRFRGRGGLYRGGSNPDYFHYASSNRQFSSRGRGHNYTSNQSGEGDDE
jgi:hypothetical protein